MNINQIDELAQADKTLRASRYDGYDLVKTGCVGYVLGRFRAAPIVVGIGAGIVLDTYVKLPRVEPYVNEMIEKVKQWADK